MNAVLAYRPYAAAKHLALYKCLLDAGADPNLLSLDKYKQSAFHMSNAQGYTPSLMKFFILNGANVNAYDGRGRSLALTTAIARRDTETVKFLLEHGANPNLKTPKNQQAEILKHSVFLSDVEILTLLLEFGANPNLYSGDVSPIKAAVAKGCLGCVKMLAKYGADFQYQNLLLRVTGGKPDIENG